MASALRFLVSPTSGVPIYRQLMDQVRVQAATGRMNPGEFLPSIRQVAQDLQINPMTVSKAYSLLEREGVVRNVRGQGMCLANGAPGETTLRQRQKRLLPLLQQAAAAAVQLGLSADQVRALFDPLLVELEQHDHANRD